MKRLNRIVLSLSILAGLLAAGTLIYPLIQPSSSIPASDEQTELISVPSNLAGFYSQKPLWRDCEGSNKKARCGFIQVPLNWDKPEQGGIQIAIAINPTSNPQNSPYLLMNPGGPGGSGTEWVTKYLDSLGTSKLRSHYNIVGFDPRGVGSSTAVKCYDTEGMKSFLYDPSPYEWGSAKDIAFSKSAIKDFGAACLKNTGALLGHVDTSSAAKDMDIIRAVLGSEKLNYLGFSYGTILGATYAAFFPTKVGKFVLDGVVDPTNTPEQESLNQLAGFQSAMKSYLADCIKNDGTCPFAGLTVNQAMQKVGNEFLSPLEEKSIKTSEKGRLLNASVGFTGMLSALYSKESWQYLTAAFKEFFNKKKQDGRIFLLLADSYNEYDDATGTFQSNSNEAFKAISCLDSRESKNNADMEVQNAKALKISSVFGHYWQYGGLACHDWPFDVVAGPKDYSAKNAPTMLVVGTTNDPATPYKQTAHFANKVLAHGRLLTYKGEGHTAYGSSNACIANSVDGFLINNKLPAKEKTC